MATRKLHKYTEEVNVGWGGYVLVKYCRLMVEVFIKFCIKNIYKETYFSLFLYIYIKFILKGSKCDSEGSTRPLHKHQQPELLMQNMLNKWIWWFQFHLCSANSQQQ